MTKPTPLSQVVADDLLIDRVAGRQSAGDDPIASLLAALAEHADRPLGRGPTGRRFRRQRVFSAIAALTIGASGAGVAAAATVPDGAPSAAPAMVSRAPGRPASDLGAELVRDAAGRVLVVGVDGTRFDSGWLPDVVSPVLLAPAAFLGRSSGAAASRDRWVALDGTTAILLARPEQGLDDPGRVGSTPQQEAEQGAAAGPTDEAASPVEPLAGPVDESAAEPNGTTTTAAAPSDDVNDDTSGADDSAAAPSGPDFTMPADIGKPAQAGKPADTGKPAVTGKPAQAGEPGVGRHSGTKQAVTQPPQPTGPGVRAAEAPIPMPASGSAPAGDAGLAAAPTFPVMVPLPTVPLAVVPDPS